MTAAPAASSTGRSLPSWVPAGVLVVVHLAVAFTVRPGPRWNDAIWVLNYARDFPDVPLNHHALRIGNIFPARFFLEVFGYGQVAYYAWPLLMGILLVVATYLLASRLFGRMAGFAAGLLVIFHPVLVDTEIRFGTERMASWHLLPDVPATALLTLGFFLLIAGAEWRTGDRGPRATLLFVGAGLCFGYAYLVRELSAFVFPVIAGALLGWRQPLRRWVQVAVPMLACLALEFALAAAIHGHPLARLRIGAEHGSARTDLTRMDALLRFPRVVIAYPQTAAVLTALALTILAAVLFRRRGHVLMAGWFASVWLPLTMFSGLLNPRHIQINVSLMRYWIVVIPVLCIGAAGAVAALLRHYRRWAATRGPGAASSAATVTAVVTVAALALWILPMADEIAANPRDRDWNAIRSYLAAHDDDVATIITDDRDALTLGVYQYEPVGGDKVWEAEVDIVAHGRNVRPKPAGPGTYLLWTPQVSRTPPRRAAGWEPVVQRPELRLYRSAEASTG